MSNVEEYAKNKTNEMINGLKQKMEAKGLVMTKRDEYFLRAGIEYGVTLSSLTLANLPVNITFEENGEVVCAY